MLYDNAKLQRAMAEQKLNFYRLSKLASVSNHTVKKVIVDGKGAPESWDAIAKALKFRRGVKDIIKRPGCCQYSGRSK